MPSPNAPPLRTASVGFEFSICGIGGTSGTGVYGCSSVKSGKGITGGGVCGGAGGRGYGGKAYGADGLAYGCAGRYPPLHCIVGALGGGYTGVHGLVYDRAGGYLLIHGLAALYGCASFLWLLR